METAELVILITVHYNFECWLNKASSESFEKDLETLKDYKPYGKREGLLDGV